MDTRYRNSSWLKKDLHHNTTTKNILLVKGKLQPVIKSEADAEENGFNSLWSELP